MGSRMAAAAGRALKAGAVVGVAAAGAAMGAALVGGFRSAIDQQKIQATLGGLYQDGNKAFKTLEQIKNLSKTSPIDYSAYGKAAQSLAYAGVEGDDAVKVLDQVGWAIVDRKSTRLNSSHVSISYAVFCLKKKMNSLYNQCQYRHAE